MPLDSAVISGDVAVFVSPDSGVDRVRFYISGSHEQTENSSPWDLAGTSHNGTARLYDSEDIDDGAHLLTAEIELENGGFEVLVASFDVANDGPVLAFSATTLRFNASEAELAPSQTVDLTLDGTSAPYDVTDNRSWLDVSPSSGTTPDTLTVTVDTMSLAPGVYTGTVFASTPGLPAATLTVSVSVVSAAADTHMLLFSRSPDRSGSNPLNGQTVSGEIYVFLTTAGPVDSATFYLDGDHNQTENNAPWDFEGGSISVADDFDTDNLPDGTYTISASLKLEPGGVDVISASFTIDNTP